MFARYIEASLRCFRGLPTVWYAKEHMVAMGIPVYHELGSAYAKTPRFHSRKRDLAVGQKYICQKQTHICHICRIVHNISASGYAHDGLWIHLWSSAHSFGT